MSRRLCANKRGISPVVATVILVAVTIVVAVAVAYWMGGIAGLYTRYEKLEITSIYAEYNATVKNFTITVYVKNTGSADATIDNVLLNGKPYNTFNATLTRSLPISLSVGNSTTIVINIGSGEPFVSGVSVEVRLHSAGGQEYPKTVTLP
ncbi:type IV pilin [Candidatus Bathyarchaeota archaeon]|nr:type IV pilin [Candidatus Bathyarchaeota archaeon]